MKFLIVDGLSETRNNFRKYLENCVPNAEIFESISAEDALFNLIDQEVNLIISSEILSFRNGFELSRIVKKLNANVPVIIIANDASNAIEAIRNNVFDFLLEPINPEHFEIAINKAIAYIESALLKTDKVYDQSVKIRFSLSSGYKLINLDELAYCIADGSYTNIFYTNGSVDLSSYNLGKIEKQLLKYHFVRINRSTIVNMKLLRHIDKHKMICVIEVFDVMKTFKITSLNIDKLVNDHVTK